MDQVQNKIGGYILRNLTAADNGIYSCSATNTVTGAEIKMPQRFSITVASTSRSAPTWVEKVYLRSWGNKINFSMLQLPTGAANSIFSKTRRESSSWMPGHCESTPEGNVEPSRPQLGPSQQSGECSRLWTSNWRHPSWWSGHLHLSIRQWRTASESSHDPTERSSHAAHCRISENVADKWKRSTWAALSSDGLACTGNLLDD